MKKLAALAIALALAGCATVPAAPERQAVHVVPKAKPKHVAAPSVPADVPTVVPVAPVQPDTFEMRWKKRAGAVRSHIHFFHQRSQ